MAKNVRTEAKHDVVSSAHDPARLAHKMETYAGSPMYLAEVAELLRLTNQWDDFKRSGHAANLYGEAERGAAQLAQASIDALAHKHDPNARLRDLAQHSNDLVYLSRYAAWLYEHKQLGHVPHDPQARYYYGRALGQAEHDGLVPAEAITKLHERQLDSRTDDPLEQQATERVVGSADDLRGKLHDARRHLGALEDDLQLQLHELGPALWNPGESDPGQREAQRRRVAAYIEAFRASKQYRDAKARVATCAGALHGELANEEREVMAHAHDPMAPTESHRAVDVLLGSYEQLALTEAQASDALVWAARHLNDQHFAAERARVRHIFELAGATVAYYAGVHIRDVLHRPGKSRRSNIRAAIDYLRTAIVTAYEKYDEIKGTAELARKLDELEAHLGDGAHVPEHMAELVMRVQGNTSNVIRRVQTELAMLLGANEHGADVATYGASVQHLYGDLSRFKELVGKGIESPHEREHAKLLALGIRARYFEVASGVSMLQVASGVLGLREDAGDLDTTAKQVRLVADIATTLSAALDVTPLAPLGAAIGLIGSAVSLVAGAIIAGEATKHRHADERHHLANIHAFGTGPTADTITNTVTSSHAGGNLQAAQDLDLSREQTLRLAARHPHLFEGGDFIRAADATRRFLGDPANSEHAGGHVLIDPYAASLFDLLMAPHGDGADHFMQTALGCAAMCRDGETLRTRSRSDLDLIHTVWTLVAKAIPGALRKIG